MEDDGSCQLTDENLNYFTDLPNSTGLNHLVIIEDILGLEPGDELACLMLMVYYLPKIVVMSMVSSWFWSL